MKSWEEDVRNIEEEEVFEEIDAYSRGPQIKSLANMYNKLNRMEKRLPNGINREDYITAKRAIKRILLDSLGSTKEDMKYDYHRIDLGDYPENNTFISYKLAANTTGGVRNGWLGLYSDYPNWDLSGKFRALILKGNRLLIISYVHGDNVYSYVYDSTEEEIYEKEINPLKKISKWRKDTEKELRKVPEWVLNEIETKF